MPEAGAALPLLYSGSVKDVYGVPGQDPYLFVFSDRYSIFDWGEMPDALSGKGEALAVMGDAFFRHLGEPATWLTWQLPESYPKFWRDSITSSPRWSSLRRQGLNHHSLGLVDDEGRELAPGARSKRLAVKALSRPAAISSVVSGKVQWDYSAYQARPQSSLVPLEVVFRFGAPEGSSFLERLESMPGYAEGFGFPEKPAAGEWFAFPIVEFFTKLEPSDRFLSREEAMQIAGLTTGEMDDLVALTLLIALRLKDLFSPLGLELWDGKFEFAFTPGEGDRGFQLVDSIGPDELRLIAPGQVHFSKEFLRRAYRGTPWFEAIGKAKRIAKERGEKDWKKICTEELKQVPAALPPAQLELAEAIYPALAEALVKSFFAR
jgi:phosphoribosylaminoimidazole-succinocarboxamide synthase